MEEWKLSIDLLPRGAWGNDLSKTLAASDWDVLRKFCYQKAGGRCEVCAEQSEKLSAHEVWDFDMQKGTQTLKAIVALCPACHGVKHMRNSRRMGFEKQAKAHFMKINACSEIEFIKHYAQAEMVFEERNSILRWKMNVDLSKFGGEGIEWKQREIPLISSGYENIDFSSVDHILYNEPIGKTHAHAVLLNLRNDMKDAAAVGEGKSRFYFVLPENGGLPPKIDSIDIDNYAGEITVIGDRAQKIQWYLDGKLIRSNYFVAGNFCSKFCVENKEGKQLIFVLTGSGGKTIGEPFLLNKAHV